jgi:Na+-transporting methylmalonyl-CoA/oxaloacetate decarboxylase gamma subunit
MINWILALLGMAIYFLGKFAKRTDKVKEPSLSFWLKDNWPESVTSVLATIAIMIIFTNKDSQFDLSSIIGGIPFIVSLPVNMVISLAIGYLNSLIFYKMFENKLDGKASNPEDKP